MGTKTFGAAKERLVHDCSDASCKAQNCRVVAFLEGRPLSRHEAAQQLSLRIKRNLGRSDKVWRLWPRRLHMIVLEVMTRTPMTAAARAPTKESDLYVTELEAKVRALEQELAAAQEELAAANREIEKLKEGALQARRMAAGFA
jgi:hypothetical protein